MNSLEILQHAYASIAQRYPDKDAFAITADVEALAKRLAEAARELDAALPVQVAAQEG